MDTNQILSIVRSDQAICQIYHGVFPIDKLPILHSLPAALVINLDDSTEPGSHWVAIYIETKSSCEYFDSYGREPEEKLRTYMNKYASKIKFNKKCIQQPLTATCGQFCIYYLIWRSRGVPLKNIVNSLDKSYADEFVTGFVNKLFKINTVTVDIKFITDQICNNFI